MQSKTIRTAIVLCSLALGSTFTTGCVSKARYNRLLAENQACQQRSDEQQARLGRVRSLLSETRSGIARAPGEELPSDTDLTEEQLIADIRNALNAQGEAVASAQPLTVQMMAKYLFPSGSADLTSEGREALRKVANWLQASNERHIFVEGYTDSVPIGPSLKRQFATNWELSVARATSVVDFLADNGVPQDRLIAVGYGEHNPIASNDSEVDRQLNRRIEIKLHDLDFEEVPAELDQTALIDINQATYSDLVILPGVTPEFARAVVDYRQRAGRISTHDDLRQVRGFDDQNMASLRSMVSYGAFGSDTGRTPVDDQQRMGTDDSFGTEGRTGDQNRDSMNPSPDRDAVTNPRDDSSYDRNRTTPSQPVNGTGTDVNGMDRQMLDQPADTTNQRSNDAINPGVDTTSPDMNNTSPDSVSPDTTGTDSGTNTTSPGGMTE